MENELYGQLNAEKLLEFDKMIKDNSRKPKIESIIETKLLKGVLQVDYEDKRYILINSLELIELINQCDKPAIFAKNLRSEFPLSWPISIYGIRIIEDEEFVKTILSSVLERSFA